MKPSLQPLFGGFVSLLVMASSSLAVPPIPEAQPLVSPTFTDAERAASITYWNSPNRYEIGARESAKTNGAFVVRLTPEASIWFNAFNRALKPKKLTATKNATEITSATRPWENWVAAKLKFDRAVAEQQAKAVNTALFDTPPATVAATLAIPANTALNATAANPTLPTPPVTAPNAFGATPLIPATPEALPPHPGPIPLDLLAAVGNAPPFAACVAPLRHTVRFDTGETFDYTDHIAISNPRNPSFRFAQGVIAGGTALSTIAPDELKRIFDAAQLSPTEARVMRAISLLEGGFDSINTYDTGFLSVGFIQFAALEEGGGSLGDVLGYEKTQNPVDFARDFHNFGVDVTAKNILNVLDPVSGAELTGNEAVRKIIDDKRLTAVFHLAGRRSTAFRAAQIHVAKTNYYPADDAVSVEIAGQTLTAKVSDVIKSEAGLATLFDRKVNTGNIRVLSQVVQNTMLQHGLTRLEETAPFEREITGAVRWRSDFLKDKTLTQPQ